MVSVKWVDVLTYCCIGFNFIIALVILNWTICFHLLKHYQCLKPRQPIVPILIGIFSVIFCGIDRSQVLLHSSLSKPIEYNGWIIVNSVCFQIWVLTIFLIAYRAWNIYYDIKFNTALHEKQWRLYINPAENNWFLKHRTTYGNPNKMIFVFIIPWLITALIYLIFIFNANAFTLLSRSILTFQSIIVMIFLIYIWYKIPKFDDIWRIRHELILTIRLFVIGLSIFIVLGLILNWQPPNWKYAILSTMGTIGALLICYSVLIYPLNKFNLPIWFCHAMYLYKHKTKIDFSKKSYKKKQSLNMLSDLELSMEDVDSNSQQISTQFYKLKAILYHKDGFRLFAAHLMKEFAIENLLFFVETSQWMEYIINKCEQENIKITIDEKASGIDVKFHKNVPKSRIVCWNRDDDRLIANHLLNLNNDIDNIDTTASGHIHSGISSGLSGGGPRVSGTLTAMSNTQTTSRSGAKSAHATQLTIDLNLDEFELSRPIEDPWLMCIKLFYKYVVNGSYFCINISGENRIELYDNIGYDTSSTKCDEELVETLKEKCDNNMDKLFHIFDTARYAVFRLMIYSVSRFETSDAYLEHFTSSDH